MTLKEILDAEAARPIPLIYLYKEGTFFKAYEMSAFYLSTVRGLKPVKRWCKSLEREYVTAGFPVTSVMKYLHALFQNVPDRVERLSATA